jgi:autotransporter-associated beta strand protein
LRLTADNTYTGETTVLAGTLELASPGAVPAGGNLTIGPGARVVLESFLYQSTGTKAARDAGPASVPEPGTMVLLVAGAVLGLGGWVKRWGLKYWGRKT